MNLSSPDPARILEIDEGTGGEMFLFWRANNVVAIVVVVVVVVVVVAVVVVSSH